MLRCKICWKVYEYDFSGFICKKNYGKVKTVTFTSLDENVKFLDLFAFPFTKC